MIYKGIFWLIEGELYTKKLECDKSGNVIGDGSGLNSKSGDNFNHRLTWEGLPKSPRQIISHPTQRTPNRLN